MRLTVKSRTHTTKLTCLVLCLIATLGSGAAAQTTGSKAPGWLCAKALDTRIPAGKPTLRGLQTGSTRISAVFVRNSGVKRRRFAPFGRGQSGHGGRKVSIPRYPIESAGLSLGNRERVMPEDFESGEFV